MSILLETGIKDIPRSKALYIQPIVSILNQVYQSEYPSGEQIDAAMNAIQDLKIYLLQG